MSEQEKQKSHVRILDAAARLFREKGLESTSVSDVMRAAGLTHGGFYRHFGSKEALVVAAFRHAVATATASLQAAQKAGERAAAQKAYIDLYLSQSHVKDTGHGCPMAAIGVDLSRAGGDAVEAGADAVGLVSDLLQREGSDDAHSGLQQLALLVGTITLARLTQDADGGLAALEAGRAALVQLSEDGAATTRS